MITFHAPSFPILSSLYLLHTYTLSLSLFIFPSLDKGTLRIPFGQIFGGLHSLRNLQGNQLQIPLVTSKLVPLTTYLVGVGVPLPPPPKWTLPQMDPWPTGPKSQIFFKTLLH